MKFDMEIISNEGGPPPPSGIGVFIASRGIIDGRGACIEVACIIYHGGEVDL